MRNLTVILLFLVLIACGGSKQGPAVGQSTASHDGSGPADLDAELKNPDGNPSQPSTTPPPPATPALVTLVVQNSAAEELVFNLDRGWASAVAAYSGTPPNAVAIEPYPRHCTMGCDATPDEVCMSCPEPENLQDIRAAQKLERVPAGGSFEIPWDGQVHNYQKTKNAEGKRCQCFGKAAPAAADYTFQVCGLRLTQEAKKKSKLQCVKANLTLPVSSPQKITFDFPTPVDAPPKKKGR